MKEWIISGRVKANDEEEARYKATLKGGHGILVFDEVKE